MRTYSRTRVPEAQPSARISTRICPYRPKNQEALCVRTLEFAVLCFEELHAVAKEGLPHASRDKGKD